MNRHLYAILMIIVIFCIPVLTYKTLYPSNLPPLSVLETQAGEDASISASASPAQVDAPSTDNGQALETDSDEPVTANPETVPKTASIDPSPTTSTSPTVSRGVQTTDTYKYPELSKVNGIFGQFRYRDLSGGMIEIDPQWIANNIVTITLPGLNQKVQVNKAAAANFIKAFNYIKNGTAIVNGRQVSLLSLIKTMDGTFVTRHVNWNPAKGLSNHSWGTAIDINADNHFRYIDPSSEPNDPNLILWEKAFKPAGFSWGNSYSDSMHFELLN